jgi:ribulose-5-phosphate 4-epimerase/fuculose-1-phosphate aldolase
MIGAHGCSDGQDPILRDHFWMNPFGVHFSSMTVSKLVLVSPDGYVHPTLGAQLPINVSG